MELQGGTPKIEEKTWISREVNAKKCKKIPGEVTVNLTENPGGSTSKKSISLTGRGGGTIRSF